MFFGVFLAEKSAKSFLRPSALTFSSLLLLLKVGAAAAVSVPPFLSLSSRQETRLIVLLLSSHRKQAGSRAQRRTSNRIRAVAAVVRFFLRFLSATRRHLLLRLFSSCLFKHHPSFKMDDKMFSNEPVLDMMRFMTGVSSWNAIENERD